MEKTKQLSKLWTRDFVTIIIINLLIFCAFQILMPTLPIYIKSLGAKDSIIGWIAGMTTISSLLMRPFSGIALDKFGRKIVFLLGIFIVILVTISYAWIPIVGIVLMVRFLHGFGWGISSTASNTIASDVIPKDRLGEGMGFFGLSSSLAMAIAPSIGLFILSTSNFKNVSLLSTILVILALILSFFIHYSDIKDNQQAEKNLCPYEKTSIGSAVVMFFVTSSYGSIIGFISLYALDRGIENIGIFFMVFAIALLLTRPICGKIVDNFGFNSVMYPSLILLMISMFILSYSTNIVYFIVVAILYGIGFGAVQSSLQTMAIINTSKNRFGAANATFFTGFDAGIGFGSVVAGIVAFRIGYSKMYLYFSVFLLVAIMVYFFITTYKKFKVL